MIDDSMQMSARQHLYAEAIYRINSELHSIVELHKDDFRDKVQLVPCSFDRRLRCFRWLSVHEQNWKWNPDLFDGAQLALKELFETDNEAVKNLLNDKGSLLDEATLEATLLSEWKKRGQPEPIATLAHRWSERLRTESKNNWDFGELTRRWIRILVAKDWDKFDSDGQCHRALVDLVAGRAIDNNQFIEGLAFNLVSEAAQAGKRVSFVISELLSGYARKKAPSGDATNPKPEYPPAKFTCHYHEGDVDRPQYYSQEAGWPPLKNKSALRSSIDNRPEDEGADFGAWARLLQNAMMRLTGNEDLKCFVTVPIYDGGTRSDPWGRLVGIVHAMIYRTTDAAECKKIADLIIAQSDRLLVAFRTTARAQVAAAPVTREDQAGSALAIQQFLRLLPRFQDWERVSVCRRGDNRSIQCWTRDKEGGVGSDWDKCGGGCDNCPTKLALTGERVAREDVFVLEEDLSELIRMPWLGKRELADIADLQFAFQLPSYAVVPPPDNEKRQRLYRQYLHEQIDMLRLLVPKVQAHRHALRTAAAAIMGRNMSHNIGSHVLARYGSKIRTDQAPASLDKPDHRGEFLTYLQRRMDFLAEVATSDRAFWSESLSLKEQIGRLNYDKQVERFSPNRPVLLSYITGKESVRASVEWGKPVGRNDAALNVDERNSNDYRIACPSGEVGIHALFVVLENIIRNSARHGSGVSTSDPVRIFVNVKDEGDSDWLMIEIIDPRALLSRDADKSAVTNEEYLPSKINRILDETLLDSDGTPNPNNWGVREMQICAHYLRGFSFSDLESRQEEARPVLRAGAYDLGADRRCLKYTLFLERAKLMAAVVNSPVSENLTELRRKGVHVVCLDSGESENWEQIANEVEGYGFMVVADNIEIPKHGTTERVSLPVRTVNLPEALIKQTAGNALKSDGTAWMEPLHKLWAEKHRDKRDVWRKKPLWGVAISFLNQALKHDDSSLPKSPEALNDGLFFVRKESGHITPLPDTVMNWHRTLQKGSAIEHSSIAAAWIDHGNAEDFDTAHAGLDYSELKNRNSGFIETIWVSAELALSDSPHSAYLNACSEGRGWEILAAAISRIAVLDERVQSELDTILRGGFRLERAWPCMGVWVPAKAGCNLDTPGFAGCREFLKKPAEKDEQFPIDVLIIHLTILEGLNRTRNEPLSDTLAALVADTRADKAEIVIVTGRGVPAIKIDTVRYLPISALLESLVTRPSKLALMRAVWSAGKPRRPNYSRREQGLRHAG